MKKRLKYFTVICDIEGEGCQVEEFFLLYPTSTNYKSATREAGEIAKEFCERHNLPHAFIMLGRCEFIKNINY